MTVFGFLTTLNALYQHLLSSNEDDIFFICNIFYLFIRINTKNEKTN